MSLENLNDTEKYFKDQMTAQGIPTDTAGMKAKLEEIATEEGLTFKNPGEYSPFWRFINTALVVPTLWLIEYLIRTVMPSLYVKTAEDAALDLRGWVYDTTRKQAETLEGLITFTRASVNTSVTIPAGTIIKSAPIDGTVYQVKTTTETEFTDGQLTADVPVTAIEAGSAYALAPGYFTILDEPITGISAVNNNEGWITSPGTDKETNENYRSRIRAKWTSVSDHHVNSVYKGIIASQTGFDYDRIFIDHTAAPRGPGSADAFVLFDADVPGESYLTEVNTYIRDNGFHGMGDDIEVKPLPETQHDIALTLWFPAGTGTETKDALTSEIEQIIRAAFRENSEYDNVTRAAPFSRFSFQRLGAEIMAEKPGALISIEWAQTDIVSTMTVPRINTLTITQDEVA